MQLLDFKKIIILITTLPLIACHAMHDPASLAHKPNGNQHELAFTSLALKQKVQAVQWVENDSFMPGANLLVATKKNGILVLNKAGESLATLTGSYGTLDHRSMPQGLLITAVDTKLQQAVVSIFPKGASAWSKPLPLPKPSFKIEDACLYKDSAHNIFVFLVGEEGLGEQWLVGESLTLRDNALLVRTLSFPPASNTCQVSDATDTLYVNEENVGLWAYKAHAEAELAREPIALRKPFGDIQLSATGIAIQNRQVFLIDTASKALHHYLLTQEGVSALPFFSLSALKSPEKLSVRTRDSVTELLVLDDNGLHTATLPQDVSYAPAAMPVHANIPMVKPVIQTELMPSLGDAADDPAIWIHPTDVRKSRVLGTDKQGGLAVYDLQGKQVQYLPAGRLNNVDLRPGFRLNDGLIDLAIASNRDHNSLHLFAINRETGMVSELQQLPTDINDMYGICMFKDKDNQFFAIVNDKDGRFEQYQLRVVNDKVSAKKVRTFSVASQPEGCVVDDQTEQLFVGEEDVAIWALDANASSPAQLSKVIAVSDIVHADIEGMALYRGSKNSYLVFSSQGNDRYAVLDARAPYNLRGVFSVGLNAELGIDGASETDGLDVTAMDLSGNNTGPWRQGMLVVQDGRKRLPVGNQNFKYIPWKSIADALSLD